MDDLRTLMEAVGGDVIIRRDGPRVEVYDYSLEDEDL